MMQAKGSNPRPLHFPHMKTGRWLRPALVALLLGLAAVAGALFPLAGGTKSTIVLACGIGNTPTMEANGTPALFNPVTKNVSASQPVGTFATNYVVGQPITFSENLSNVLNPPPQAGLQYQWTFEEGTQTVGVTTGLTAQHVFTSSGTYNVYSSIYSDGWQQFDSAQIHVVPTAFDDPPVAKITASTTTIVPDEWITFNATGSHSLDGSKLTYLWNFNDGRTATTPVASHQFPDIPGKWIIGLAVTDGRGARSLAVLHITILNFDQIPTASLTASLTTIGSGNTVTFDASGSTPPTGPGTPAGDQIVKYVWNFGDGTPAVTTSTPTVTHRYKAAGTFTATVEAIDQAGAPGSKSVTITVVALTGNAGSPPWTLYAAMALVVAILAVGGYILYTNRRRRLALIREREAALERERRRRPRSGGPPSRQGYRPGRPPSQQGYRPGGPPSQQGYQPPTQRPTSARLPQGEPQPSRQQSRYPGAPNDWG
ncbi:MAG: PKD domain-containing protein [Ktedonobacterales bacterium]